MLPGLGLWTVGPSCQHVKERYKRKLHGRGGIRHKSNQKLNRGFPLPCSSLAATVSHHGDLAGGHGNLSVRACYLRHVSVLTAGGLRVVTPIYTVLDA
jgi:hypothetical protein